MKVLVVTSNDFGEISAASIFTRNAEFQTIFAVPKIRTQFFDEPVSALHAYQSLDEVFDLIEREAPNAVLFASAYLLLDSKLGARDVFIRFFNILKERGIPVVTTDPFLRVLDADPNCRFSLLDTELVKFQADVQFASDFLKDIPHVYGFPMPSGTTPTLSIYNDRFCRFAPLEQRSEGTKWLFVLSDVDAILLMKTYGRPGLDQMMARLTEICSDPGNTVRFILAGEIIKLFHLVGFSLPNLEVLTFRPLLQFEDEIRGADVVCYWNLFSNSVFLCYYYDVPALFFAKGHVASLSPSFFDHIARRIYPDGLPEMVPFDQPIETRLPVLLDRYFDREARQNTLRRSRTLPRPDVALGAVLNA